MHSLWVRVAAAMKALHKRPLFWIWIATLHFVGTMGNILNIKAVLFTFALILILPFCLALLDISCPKNT